MENPVIIIEQLTKVYQLGSKAKDLRHTISDKFVGLFKKENPAEQNRSFEALSDVSLNVYEGEVLGIIGRNGAGKSTLLKILSEITVPTSGKVTLRGRVASLLEVGTGFHEELTGLENVYLNGSILGMTKAEINEKLDEIVDFAGIQAFMDTPLKKYSSGMKMRLAFAVAAHLEPEILLIDEVLAVGDIEFQRKCIEKMSEVARAGRTVVFVSHNLAAIENLCNRCILLEEGKIISTGSPQEVVAYYIKNVAIKPETLYKTAGKFESEGIELFAPNIEAVTAEPNIIKTGDAIKFSFKYRLPDSLNQIQKLFFKIIVRDLHGQKVFVCESDFQSGNLCEPNRKNEISCITEPIKLISGTYTIDVTINAMMSKTKIKRMLSFEVLDGDHHSHHQKMHSGTINKGYIAVSSNWEFNGHH